MVSFVCVRVMARPQLDFFVCSGYRFGFFCESSVRGPDGSFLRVHDAALPANGRSACQLSCSCVLHHSASGAYGAYLCSAPCCCCCCCSAYLRSACCCCCSAYLCSAYLRAAYLRAAFSCCPDSVHAAFSCCSAYLRAAFSCCSAYLCAAPYCWPGSVCPACLSSACVCSARSYAGHVQSQS